MWLASKCKNGPIKCSIRYCSKYWNLTNRKLVCNTKLNLLKRYFRTKITLPPQVLSNTKDFDIYCSVGVQRNDRSRMFQMEKGTFHQICPVLSCSAQAQLNLNQPQIQHSNFCNNQQSIFWECNRLPQGLETRSGNSRIRNEKQVFPCFPCSGSLEVFRNLDVGHGLGWGWGWIMLWRFCDFHLDWGRALKSRVPQLKDRNPIFSPPKSHFQDCESLEALAENSWENSKQCLEKWHPIYVSTPLSQNSKDE